MPYNKNVSHWASIELDRRLERADSDEERQAVFRDADQARRDPVFRERLAQIAETGRYRTGPHVGAQIGLAAASMAPLAAKLPVIGAALGPVGAGLGVLGAAGLFGYGAMNIGEAFQRRQEDLPWGEQAGWGAADVVLSPLGVSKLLRGLKGVKEGATRIGSRLVRPGQETPGTLVFDGKKVDVGPATRVGDEVLAGEFPSGEGLDLHKLFKEEDKFPEFLRALGRDKTSVTSIPTRYTPRGVVEDPRVRLQLGQAAPKEISPRSQIRLTPQEEVGQYNPRTGKWEGGEGLQALPEGVRSDVGKARLRRAELRGGRLRPRAERRASDPFSEEALTQRPLKTGEYIDPKTGLIAGRRLSEASPSPGVKFTERPGLDVQRTEARAALHLADARNLAAKRRNLEVPHPPDEMSRLRKDVKEEIETNQALRDLASGAAFIEKELVRPINTTTAATDFLRHASKLKKTGGGPSSTGGGGSPLPSLKTVQTGDDIADVTKEVVDKAEEGIKVSRSATRSTEVGSFADRPPVEMDMGIAESKNLADLAYQMAGLRSVMIMIQRAIPETYAAFRQVSNRPMMTAMERGPQEGLLRALFAPVMEGGEIAGTGSTPAIIFGSKAGGRTAAGANPLWRLLEKSVIYQKKTPSGEIIKEQILTRGPGGEGGVRQEGSKLLEVWFKRQREIYGKDAFKIEQTGAIADVRKRAGDRLKKGLATPYTRKMIEKTRTRPRKSKMKKGTEGQYMTTAEGLIHDQAVAYSILANRARMLEKVVRRKITPRSRIPEFGRDSVPRQFTGAYRTFMEEGLHKQRPMVIVQANKYTEWIAMLLASIAGAEMMELSGDPRATAG